MRGLLAFGRGPLGDRSSNRQAGRVSRPGDRKYFYKVQELLAQMIHSVFKCVGKLAGSIELWSGSLPGKDDHSMNNWVIGAV